MQSGTYRLGSRGTPQGAVLSPLLFNLALRGLPEALRAVPNVEHAIYADDITLWCREGSDAEIEEKLQAAADIVGEYVMRCGLKCAPEKSELLVFRNPRDKLVGHIDVVIDGVRVPKPAEVRILGQLLQQGRGNKSTIDRLDAMTTQVCGMMRRIRNRRHGIKEKEAIQLVQAFIIARLTYGTPYLNLNKAEMQKLNVLIRRAYKNALRLPERTATEKLLKLGVHNTIEELHEAQLVSQLKRLSSTVNGAWLLDKLGMAVPGGSYGPGDAGEELPAETRQRFTISRIPRNMHPDRNAERRQTRAVALARSWDSREGTLYVDGAGPVLGVAAIAVASAQGQIRRVASIRAQTVEQVEEAAIALAVVCNPRATIISDSQRACQNFARGVVGQPALRLLRKTAVEGVHLIWTPGHMGQVGNEAANAAARGALYRDSVLPQRDLDSALTYSEALKALRTHRAEYPGPAKGLSKEEEFTWRRLQTDTFVTPIQLHLWYPERYATADCPFCGFTQQSFDKVAQEAQKGPLFVSLMVDEMGIKRQTDWDGKEVVGYCDLGHGIIRNDCATFAKHTLVFLAVAVNRNWKIPLGYALIDGLDGNARANLVREYIIKLKDAGAKCISVTCDGTNCNITVLTALGVRFAQPMKSWFTHPSDPTSRVHAVLDACHVIKLMRSLLAERGCIRDGAGKVVTWRYLAALDNLQQQEGLHAANKLRKQHIDFERQKMKVSLAAQTLSRSVSCALLFCKEKGIQGFEGAEATAKFAAAVDDIFDLTNSCHPLGRGSKCPIRASNQVTILERIEQASRYLRALKDVTGKPLSQGARKTPVLGFLLVLASIKGLAEDLVWSPTPPLRCLLTRKLSQDHLELFFATVRNRTGNNNNPTALEFRSDPPGGGEFPSVAPIFPYAPQ
ncbi:hypothetical protein ISCGN_015140 [Ixodes scapularis]